MQTNQAGWLFIHKGFSARGSGYQCSWWGCCSQNVSALKGKNVCFPNCRQNHVNADFIRTNKLKLQYKVAAKVPFNRVQFESPTVRFTMFSSLLFLHDFFSRHLPLHELIWFISCILRFSHQILLCEKAFRILIQPIREAKRVSHTWKNRFVQSQTTV